MYEPEAILELIEQCVPGYTLPQAFYNDPSVYEFDIGAVFSRAWLMVGFECELPQPGSHLSITIGRNPLVIIRGRDGAIRAFHNTCRHRGAKICPDGRNRASRLVCPYHKWTYELDGRLVAAPRTRADLDLKDHSLQPVRVELLEGCIYLCLTPDAPDFEPFRKAVAPLLAPYRLASRKLAYESSLVEKANWKLVMENARECYHCAASHPELKTSFPVTMKPGFDFGKDEHQLRYHARMNKLGWSTVPQGGKW